MTPDEDGPLVTITWSDGPVVSLDRSWRSRGDAGSLLSEIERLMRETQADSTPGVELANVPLADYPEVAAMLRDARAERHAAPPAALEQNRTRHFVSTWVDGRFAALSGRLAWVDEAPNQALAEELAEVLTPPATEPRRPGPAQARLDRYMKEHNRG